MWTQNSHKPISSRQNRILRVFRNEKAIAHLLARRIASVRPFGGREGRRIRRCCPDRKYAKTCFAIEAQCVPSQGNFEDEVNDKELMLVEFYAPCKRGLAYRVRSFFLT